MRFSTGRDESGTHLKEDAGEFRVRHPDGGEAGDAYKRIALAERERVANEPEG